ncbi:MAG: hypothetical protein KGL35_04570, partial [Bradyrhizobium sp.]|nr:hypothetical protein [Bradyrhizobium sp.]
MSDWPPISEVLEHYGFEIPPVRGQWTRIRCRFHDDRVASAAFSVDLNGFSCLACGVKGSALTLIMDREGCSHSKALEYARDWFGD